MLRVNAGMKTACWDTQHHGSIVRQRGQKRASAEVAFQLRRAWQEQPLVRSGQEHELL